VCWEKFCRYWDVAENYVPVEEGRYGITPQLARQHIDENTIGARLKLNSNGAAPAAQCITYGAERSALQQRCAILFVQR
jgi:glutamate/tyrosine decarboxylase-like PLP-dependent enzyme